MPQKVPVSVLLIVKNEEMNIRHCLESTKWADQVIVVDSQSTDKTVEIAKKYTRDIYQFVWDGKFYKKQWAFDHVKFSHDWILMIDADERVTEGFRNEIESIVADSSNAAAGYIVRYDYWFLGRFIKFGDPVRKIILFRKSKSSFEPFKVAGRESIKNIKLETGHELPIIKGKIDFARKRMLHADQRPLYDYFDRHNRYSTWEAEHLFMKFHLQDAIESNTVDSPVKLRRFFKNIFMRLPFKPFVYFFYGYIFRLGFLDGYPGLCYNVCKSIYAYQIALKFYELKLRAKGDVPCQQSL